MNVILLTIKFCACVEKVIKLTMMMRGIASMWMNVVRITMEGKNDDDDDDDCFILQ
jgi:hypothetical protein